MANYITEITAPTLGSATFATDLSEAFRNIDDNFKKIVAAPYLEGQEGNSVEPFDMLIIDGGVLTDFGAKMCRVIFDSNDISTIQDIDTIAPPIGSGTKKASDYLIQNPSVKVFRVTDPDLDPTANVTRWVCAAEYYCYIDLRIKDLDGTNPNAIGGNFNDYSCAVFGNYDTDWVFTKSTMLPTLYYSAEQQCFCWKINDIETGIRAQGLKGEPGKPPVSAVVRGSGTVTDIQLYPQNDQTTRILTVIVEEYLDLYGYQSDTDSQQYYQTSWKPINESDLEDGDLVACIFDISDDTYSDASYYDMVIANIQKLGETEYQYTITAPDMNRFSSMWRSNLMYHACRDIDYKTVDQLKSKALFVPTSTDGIGHAMFQDDSGVVYDRVGDNWSSTDYLNKENLVFKKVDQTKIIGSDAMDSRLTDQYENETTTKAKFIGYELQANVNGVEGVNVGVPVGSVVNWINMNNVPDGWFRTGEVNDASQHQVVFKLVESSTYTDVRITGGFNKTFMITDSTGNRDTRFLGIFCTIGGFQTGRPVYIETQETSFPDYFTNERFNWNEFDCEQSGNDIEFYLTKYTN